MKLIFMQDTINYLHSIDPQIIANLEVLGSPIPVEIIEKEIKYYKYEI